MYCLIDGAAGIYVPQEFVSRYDTKLWNVKRDDVEILEHGPDHEYYWETWDDVLSYAHYIDENGIEFQLYQDSDLFAIGADEEIE